MNDKEQKWWLEGDPKLVSTRILLEALKSFNAKEWSQMGVSFAVGIRLLDGLVSAEDVVTLLPKENKYHFEKEVSRRIKREGGSGAATADELVNDFRATRSKEKLFETNTETGLLQLTEAGEALADDVLKDYDSNTNSHPYIQQVLDNARALSEERFGV